MADQKNDDTKTPFVRRGARPFAGPAGSSAPNRPFIRPVTAQRPTAAPFVAPMPGKLVLRNPAPGSVAKTPTPVAPASIPSADIDATPHSTRPVTNENGALDAIDSFDAVWAVSEPSGSPVEPGPVASPLDESSLGSGTDGQQLWAEDITANDMSADESEAVGVPVTIESSDAAASTTPAWLEDDPAAPAEPPPPAVPPPVSVEPENTASVNDVPSPTVVQPVSDTGGGYAFGEWTDSHTIPAFDEIMGVLSGQPVAPFPDSLGTAPPTRTGWTGDDAPDSPEPSPRFELVEANPEPQPEVNREETRLAVVTAAAAAEAYSPHEARIAASFDRLADRVRRGEIDVSSIAPEATDAAILASVLAALLGGSRSR